MEKGTKRDAHWSVVLPVGELRFRGGGAAVKLAGGGACVAFFAGGGGCVAFFAVGAGAGLASVTFFVLCAGAAAVAAVGGAGAGAALFVEFFELPANSSQLSGQNYGLKVVLYAAW